MDGSSNSCGESRCAFGVLSQSSAGRDPGSCPSSVFPAWVMPVCAAAVPGGFVLLPQLCLVRSAFVNSSSLAFSFKLSGVCVVLLIALTC